MRRCTMMFVLVIALLVPIANAQTSSDSEDSGIAYSITFAVGSAQSQEPDNFRKGFDPSFGTLLGVGATKSMFELSVSFDYNFFLSATNDPYDVNVFMTFLNLKISPLKTTARPYLIAGAGLYSTWIVDLDLDENVGGFHAGAGLEFVIDKVRHLFLEGRYVQGQTRKTEEKANTEIITGRLGVSWFIR